MKILIGVLLTLVILIVGSIIFIYSGLYDVSAFNQDRGIMRWVLNTTSDKSVEHYSKDISVPNLTDPLMIKEGFEHYNEMCESCHGAPGKGESDLAKGLNPHAPHLVRSARHMSPQELFWETKNGIKMTGMPAWGKTHSDEKIWAMVAFMKKLPDISAEEYKKMESEAEPMEEDTNTRYKKEPGVKKMK
jgi:mono/diheme cytochrome c family protein